MTYKVQIDDLIRDATTDEIAQIEAIHTESEAEKVAEAEKAAAKSAAKAKLAALGLTAEDLKALNL